MIVQVADPPFILISHLEVCLPEVIAMRTLEPTFTPDPSWFEDGVVQSSLDENAIDRSMTDRRDPSNPIVSQVSLNLVRPPMFAASQFQDDVNG